MPEVEAAWILDSQLIEKLRGMELVDYVRIGMTWIADYPPGDPRDKDGVEGA